MLPLLPSTSLVLASMSDFKPYLLTSDISLFCINSSLNFFRFYSTKPIFDLNFSVNFAVFSSKATTGALNTCLQNSMKLGGFRCPAFFSSSVSSMYSLTSKVLFNFSIYSSTFATVSSSFLRASLTYSSLFFVSLTTIFLRSVIS